MRKRKRKQKRDYSVEKKSQIWDWNSKYSWSVSLIVANIFHVRQFSGSSFILLFFSLFRHEPNERELLWVGLSICEVCVNNVPIHRKQSINANEKLQYVRFRIFSFFSSTCDQSTARTTIRSTNREHQTENKMRKYSKRKSGRQSRNHYLLDFSFDFSFFNSFGSKWTAVEAYAYFFRAFTFFGRPIIIYYYYNITYSQLQIIIIHGDNAIHSICYLAASKRWRIFFFFQW